MRVMITLSDDAFAVLAGGILAARRAPTMLRQQLEAGAEGEGLPPEIARGLIEWASTANVLAFDEDAITPELEHDGAAYFDQCAAASLLRLMSSGNPSDAFRRLVTPAREPGA